MLSALALAVTAKADMGNLTFITEQLALIPPCGVRYFPDSGAAQS